MQAASPRSELTTEHIKSHLQKYRLNYERSRLELQKPNSRNSRPPSKRRSQLRDREGSGKSSAMSSIRSMKRLKESDSNNHDKLRSDFVHISESYTEEVVQRPRSLVYDQELITEAVAVDVCRYPVSQVPELADPQWNVFMWPPFTEAGGVEREGALSTQPQQTMYRSNDGEAAMLHEESSERQMQLTMQTQMNFHRQMLTRKVEETARDLSQ
ncbi:hypothetical protein BBJ28_00026877, partial [Nothophytophthora sp. Chile5]